MLPLMIIAAAASQPFVTTPPHFPPIAVRNEADAKQLALARRQHAAYIAPGKWEQQGAAWSSQVDLADYRLLAAISPAEGA